MRCKTFLCGLTAAGLWTLGAGCGSKAARQDASLEAPLAECEAMVVAMDRCVGRTPNAGSVEALRASVHSSKATTEAERTALRERCIQGRRQLERACQ